MFGRKHLFERPPLGQSRSEGAMRDAEPPRPFSQAVSFSVVCKLPCFARVLRLFRFRSPATVALFVVAVTIDSVNRSFRKWLRPHVLKEVDKGIEPPLADRDALSAIEVIIRVACLVASPLHFLPRRVFGRFAHAFGACAMAATRLSGFFSEFGTSHGSSFATLAAAQPSRIAALSVACKLQHDQLVVHIANFVHALLAAPTRLNAFIAQCTSSNYVLVSAFASAVPVRAREGLEFAASVIKNGQLSVDIARLIFDAGRNLDRIIRRHDSTPIKLDCDRAEAVHHDCLGSFYFST